MDVDLPTRQTPTANAAHLVFWYQRHSGNIPRTFIQNCLCETSLLDGGDLQSQSCHPRLVWRYCTSLYLCHFEKVPFCQGNPKPQCRTLGPGWCTTCSSSSWTTCTSGWRLPGLNNKIFPNKKDLKKLFFKAIHNWSKLNSIPCPPDNWVLQYFEPMWQDHNNRITEHLTAATIQQLQEQFEDWIFHNEDKRASSLRIFCPCQYFQCIEKTFSDPAIFSQSHELPPDTLKITIEHLRNKFDKDYPWALGRGKSLPSGYILAKGKKQYRLGRPIIGFFDSPFKPMLSTLAKLLFQIIPRACPNHFARGDVYQLLKLPRNYATTMEDTALRLYNQDLAGFFISIDTTRFLESWQILLRFLAPHMSVDENEYFSVSPVKQNNPGGIIKGRIFRTLNVNRHLTSPNRWHSIIDCGGTSNAKFPTWFSGLHPSTRLSYGPTSFTCLVPNGGIGVRTDMVPHSRGVYHQHASPCSFSTICWQQVGSFSIIYSWSSGLPDFDCRLLQVTYCNGDWTWPRVSWFSIGVEPVWDDIPEPEWHESSFMTNVCLPFSSSPQWFCIQVLHST